MTGSSIDDGAGLGATNMDDRRDATALNRLEGHYRQLLAGLDAGYAVLEVRFDGERAIDYRFVEVNEAFERQSGLIGVVGRLASDVATTLEPHWFETYGRVAKTGEPARFEYRVAALGRWFDVHAFRIGGLEDRQVAVLFRDASDRRRSEQALEDSSERLEQALAAGHGIGIWDWDVPADRVRADARFASLYGVPPALAERGAPLTDFFACVHPDDLARLKPAIAEALRTGEPFSEEYRLLKGDGCIRWVTAQGRCRLAGDGSPLHFPGVSFDITDRKRIEVHQAALLAVGDRIRDIDDPDDLAYAACEILARTLDVSRVGYGIVDKTAETITIDRDWNAPGIRSLAGVLRFRDYGSYIEDLKRGETVIVVDAETDPRTGSTAEALKAISAQAFVNMPLVEQGGFVALLYTNHATARPWAEEELALMRDVAERVRSASERLRAEAARRASVAELARLNDRLEIEVAERTRELNRIWTSTNDLMGTAGLDGYLKAVNPAWTRMLGWSEAELLSRPFAALIDPTDLAETADVVRRLGAGEPVTDFVDHVAEKGGGQRVVMWDAVPDGDVFHIVGRDLTAQRRAEEQLRQSQKMEAVGQLTGGIAHDFNNLLTGISGSLEILSTRIAQGRLKDVERYASAAQGATKRAAALTHRLLAFSRRQTLDPKPTDVNRLVAGMEEMLRRTVGPVIEIEVVAAGGLWATLIDPNQLENALLNLCINARDAMPEGGRLTIETGNRWLDTRAARDRDLPPGQYVSLCVSDTGTGMTPEIIAKAFDPFFTTKPLGQGTGLGLSMIYGFTRQSGGQVRIYSEVGQGAMVCLYLPRHHGGQADDIEPTPHLQAAPRAGAGETVLVVDDEPTVRMLVAEVLEELGYAAVEAADGASGLKVLESDARIDLLVTDVGLPGGMNGRQMADAARIVRPDLKVLFITGYAENAVVGNGHLDHGMHVMTKPFAMDALAARIKELIGNP